ncbi:MAG: hypothetical protein ACP5PT_04705 [Brevinematia bacterium]
MLLKGTRAYKYVIEAAASIVMISYIILFSSNGCFVKEKILLAYNTYQFFTITLVSLLVIITLIVSKLTPMVIIVLKMNIVKKTVKIKVDVAKVVHYTYLSVLCIFIFIILLPVFNIIKVYGFVDTDSSNYNLLLHKLFPEYYPQYFVSYYENDDIFMRVSSTCPIIYSIGGIYSVEAYSSGKILIRGGHFPYLPFILSDINISNITAYSLVLKRYPFLRNFELPREFCLQIPSEEHREISFRALLSDLIKNSPSFYKVSKELTKNNVILISKFYKVYKVKI